MKMGIKYSLVAGSCGFGSKGEVNGGPTILADSVTIGGGVYGGERRSKGMALA
jgi:hypothetical protein